MHFDGAIRAVRGEAAAVQGYAVVLAAGVVIAPVFGDGEALIVGFGVGVFFQIGIVIADFQHEIRRFAHFVDDVGVGIDDGDGVYVKGYDQVGVGGTGPVFSGRADVTSAGHQGGGVEAEWVAVEMAADDVRRSEQRKILVALHILLMGRVGQHWGRFVGHRRLRWYGWDGMRG